MYDYRRWTREEREAVLRERKQRGYPWHAPPHLESPTQFRILTGTCFQHRLVLTTSTRLAWFENELLTAIKELEAPCAVWCVLPNHYHVLVQVHDMRQLTKALGRLHGRTSFVMNTEDGERGRQVWYRAQDRVMRSERHYCATLNYIHNNPVKHGYVKLWTDWPFSSVHWYLKNKGRAWLLDLWRNYPVLNYGDQWDI